MKRIPKITAILMVIAVIFGCHEEPEPHAPTLIEPEDGAVFDTLLPENFIWSADGWKEEFYLYLAVGSVAETLIISGDTSIEFTPLTGIDGTIDGYYEWAVAAIAEDEALWSDIHSFTISTMKYGPTLLSPDDSSVVYGQSLVFSWTSDRPADMYTLYILSDYLIFQNVSDTFYDLSSSEYSDLQAGDYTWYVTKHVNDWRFPSETRHFTIAEPIDLDTTYFPFGLGYEWTYHRHIHEEAWGTDTNWSWNRYDTIVLKVVDSTFTGYGWNFKVEGNGYGFRDVGWTPEIIGDDAKVIWNHLFWGEMPVNVAQPKPTTYKEGYDDCNLKVTVEYISDTLSICVKEFDIIEGFYEKSTLRTRNIGVVKQTYMQTIGDVVYNYFEKDSLILFTTPEGQRYP